MRPHLSAWGYPRSGYSHLCSKCDRVPQGIRAAQLDHGWTQTLWSLAKTMRSLQLTADLQVVVLLVLSQGFWFVPTHDGNVVLYKLSMLFVKFTLLFPHRNCYFHTRFAQLHISFVFLRGIHWLKHIFTETPMDCAWIKQANWFLVFCSYSLG